jgi:phosphoribosylglycinamide formyltransferase-1
MINLLSLNRKVKKIRLNLKMIFQKLNSMENPKNIVIFVSGNGSNMSNLISHFDSNPEINVEAVFSNKKDCLGITNAQEAGVNTVAFSKQELEEGNVTELVDLLNVDLIVLAGFLLKIPKEFTSHFENKIVNVHPSLLPKFGGKGMYGKHVHRAVIEAGETKSGITFHYVNENYDEGNIIEQFECEINPKDTWKDLQNNIQQLEHEHFPVVIEKLLTQ